MADQFLSADEQVFSSDYTVFVTLATSSASLGVSCVADLKLVPEPKVSQKNISQGSYKYPKLDQQFLLRQCGLVQAQRRPGH